MTFSMPYLPEVSVNHSHVRSRSTGNPVLKREVAQWKNMLRQKVTMWIDEENIQLEPGKQVIIQLSAHFPQQPGQKPDGDNFIKHAQDSIADAFGVGQRGDYLFLSQVVAVSHDHMERGELIYEIIPNVDPRVSPHAQETQAP